MSRVRTPESEELSVVKKPRAPRTRSVGVADGEMDVAAPRKRAPRKVTTTTIAKSEDTYTELQNRKAPTNMATNRHHSKRNLRTFMIVCFVCVVISGSGVVVGMFDKGAIDVIAVVNDRNEKIGRGEVRDAVTGETITVSVPVQTDTRPNGGLQIADPTLAPAVTPAPAPAASSTATTTETIASSTPPVSPTTDPAPTPAS